MKKVTFIWMAAILAGCSSTPNTDGHRVTTLDNYGSADEYIEVYPLGDELMMGDIEEMESPSTSVEDVPNGDHSLESYLTSVNSIAMVTRSSLTDMQAQLLSVVDEEYKEQYGSLASEYKKTMESHLANDSGYNAPVFFNSDIKSLELLLENGERLSEYEQKELTLNLELLKAKQRELELTERYDHEVEFERVKNNLRYAFQQAKFDLELGHKREVSQILMEGEMNQFYGEKLESVRLNIVALKVAIEELENDVYGWGVDDGSGALDKSAEGEKAAFDESTDAPSTIVINEELL